MSQVNESIEYGIEVPGRGFIGYLGTLKPVLEMGVEDRRDALKMLSSAMSQYVNMGCPEIAKTLRIVTRTVTVTRSDWRQLVIPESDDA